MGSRKKIKSGATPEEMLLLLAKAEEKEEILEKKHKEETKTENNKSGHSKDSKCKEGKETSSTAAQKKTKAKTHDTSKTKSKDKTENKAHTKPIKKEKDESSTNIERGATPEEMLLLISKGEEREAKENVSIKNVTKAKTEFENTTENKILQILETPPLETNKAYMRIFLNILRPSSTKIKVVALLALATLSATALTFGLSVVNLSPGVVRDALKIPEQAQIVTIDFTANETDLYQKIVKPYPVQPKKTTLTVMNVYHQINRALLTTEGNININLIQSSDNNRWEINFDSSTSFAFSDISIPADAVIKSVVVFVEHFEEEGFNQGELEWAIVTGQPTRSVVIASIKAPVQIGESDEAFDSWDITSLVDTCEKINSFQLQVKNNNNVTESKTLIDYAYVTVKWE